MVRRGEIMSAKTTQTFTRTLKGIVKLNIKFKNTTGLLIRAPLQAQAFRIGGADQYPMVTRKEYRDGIELEVPYIPGSSIKGRMRSLLELSMNLKLYTTDYKIWHHVRNIKAMGADFINDVMSRCLVDDLFGWSSANYAQIKEMIEKFRVKDVNVDDLFKMLAPTRLLVSDFFPSEEYVKKANITSISDFLEEKSENRIDRITSAADPRTVVRVKPGVEFKGDITMLLFDNDKNRVKDYLKTIAIGLDLIEQTYLGGSGSRGYGRIRFEKIIVKAFKVNRKGEGKAPAREPIDLEKEEFNSIKEFAEAIEKLAEDIEKNLYGEG